MHNKTTPEEYLNRFEQATEKMLKITKNKNHDYSGENVAFKNFELIEFASEGDISTEQGFLVRMADKFTRITNLLKNKAAVDDESIEDTLLDLANYSILLKIYIETSKDDNDLYSIQN